MKVGIIGGAGYTAGELIRLLINHPEVDIAFVHSSSNAGQPVASVHEDLYGECDIIFSDSFDLTSIDTLFLCAGHGFSHAFWKEHELPSSLKVIDLAQDFRDESNGYVYGLPEVNFDRIKSARLIANPGCFATAIQLSLLPLASLGKLGGEVHTTAITGSTGAGVKPSPTTHFSWRNNNLSVYKAFEHQHLTEILQTLQNLQPSFCGNLNFIPVRGDFPRGIYAMTYLTSKLTFGEAKQIYEDYYADAPFTFVSENPISMKQVINTNKAFLCLEKHGDKLLITCAIDNLLKGASGQAVQNMNIMHGFEQQTGLKLKPLAF